MTRHILLEQAYRYDIPINIGGPAGGTFNQDKGYWIRDSDGAALMESDDMPLCATKKCDRETGEDQKGE